MLTRRNIISLASHAALSHFLPNVNASHKKYRSIIWVWPDGGAPQTDMFDAKPGSPTIVRGSLSPLAAPGVSGSGKPVIVTECFANMAKVLKYCTVLRARYASFTFHLEAMKSVLGRSISGDHVMSRHARAVGGTDFVYGETKDVISGSNYRADAFSVGKAVEIQWSKDKLMYSVPKLPALTPRDISRRDLLRAVEARGTVKNIRFDAVAEHTYDLMAKGASVAISDKLIERYGGRNDTAMGLLTMRELCRTGFSGAMLFRDGDWDTHQKSQEAVKARAPQLDKALAELIVDINNGVLGDTLLVYCGEFGRTPRINHEAGRDHFEWHTALLCGNGIKRGYAHGDTDNYGVGATGVVTDAAFLEIIASAVDPANKSSVPAVHAR